MRYQLHDYQQQAIDDIDQGFANGSLRQMLAMPTGSGKTVTAATMIHNKRQQGDTSLFIVDRIELVSQAAATLNNMGLQVGILQGDNTDVQPHDEVVVASIQTIRSRGVGCFGFIIIDEAHILHTAHIDLMKQYFYIPTVGLSATPLRKDLGKHFDRMVRGPSVKHLMEQGHLVKKVIAYCPGAQAIDSVLDGIKTQGGDFKNKDLSSAINSKELVGDIVSTWQDKAHDRQTLCFAVDIAHSKAIIEDFQREGIRAEHIDCHTDDDDRRNLIAGFRNQDIQILSSVNVLGIGFDVPAASCAILARPTLSKTLDMQQKGRVLRKCDGKEDAIILDHAGNTLRFGLPQDFTVPDLTNEDHTSTRAKRKQQKMVPCSECGYVLEPGQMTCPGCGFDRQVKQSKVHYIDGRLIEYGHDGGEQGYTLDEKRNWYLALLWQARHMTKRDGTTYSDKWAAHAWRDKFKAEKFPPWGWQRETPVVPDDEQQRWIKYYRIRAAKAWRKQA
ncbi:MAG: DEAD/DEAH box helicase family protein [Pseudomonadota bacterium]